MTFEYALKNAKEKEWYCQGGGIKAGFVLTQYPVGFYRWGNDGMFVFQRGNWNMAYFDKATEKENLDRELKNYLSDP
ncbi:hypothetical protein KY362_06235, partial [Candidatus Woesearchaeota archaeon]|nr:hypothetical protein [Candidatus Woesearchaeota archaeon]